jgi:hypothetical protein
VIRAAVASMIVLMLTATVGCLKRRGSKDEGEGGGKQPPRSLDHSRGFSEDGLDTVRDVSAYAQFCKQVLDLPPEPLAPFNCLDGAEIPITIDGKLPDAEAYERLRRRDIGCDKPAWLGDEPCANYTFVQRRALSADVDATLFCRRRTFTNHKTKAERLADYRSDPTFDNFRLLYDFDSLGLIWTSKKTGHTCFFDFVGRVYGGYVPSPDVRELPEFAALPDPKPPKTLPPGISPDVVWRKNGAGTWRTPQEVVEKDNCVRCHDAGPYKSSPYIEQVFDVPPHDVNLPFIVVGKAFESWRERFPLHAVSTAPIALADGGSQPQACTACHRIGSQATCKTFLGHSIGTTAAGKLSAQGELFVNRTWMPPVVTGWHGSESELNAQWTSLFGKHVDRMVCCCSDPTAKGCTRQAIDVTPLPAPVDGNGPNSCL